MLQNKLQNTNVKIVYKENEQALFLTKLQAKQFYRMDPRSTDGIRQSCEHPLLTIQIERERIDRYIL